MPSGNRFHPAFPYELNDALDDYDEFSVKTGNRFRLTIKKRFALITNNPELFAVAYDDVRIARVPKFPYSIHYRLVGKIPKFLALLHTSVARENWPDRK